MKVFTRQDPIRLQLAHVAPLSPDAALHHGSQRNQTGPFKPESSKNPAETRQPPSISAPQRKVRFPAAGRSKTGGCRRGAARLLPPLESTPFRRRCLVEGFSPRATRRSRGAGATPSGGRRGGGIIGPAHGPLGAADQEARGAERPRADGLRGRDGRRCPAAPRRGSGTRSRGSFGLPPGRRRGTLASVDAARAARAGRRKAATYRRSARGGPPIALRAQALAAAAASILEPFWGSLGARATGRASDPAGPARVGRGST